MPTNGIQLRDAVRVHTTACYYGDGVEDDSDSDDDSIDTPDIKRGFLPPSSFYEIKEIASDGSVVDFSQFKGKVVYGLNVASKWIWTKREYELLRELAEEYGDDLVIIAFPTKEFGAQEFQEDEDIARFAKEQKFPGVLLKRTEVLPWAKGQCDTYRFLYKKIDFVIGWNFSGKFLISHTGQPKMTTNPKKDIKSLIKKSKKSI